MTGDKLAREISAIRSDIPVILYTGFSDLVDEESAKAVGISAYHQANFRANVLLDRKECYRWGKVEVMVVLPEPGSTVRTAAGLLAGDASKK
jgi:hypothetical protein